MSSHRTQSRIRSYACVFWKIAHGVGGPKGAGATKRRENKVTRTFFPLTRGGKGKRYLGSDIELDHCIDPLSKGQETIPFFSRGMFCVCFRVCSFLLQFMR